MPSNVPPGDPERIDGDDSLDDLAQRVGVDFDDRALLERAVTHPSYANEHAEAPPGGNERLEFLGDAVLSMIVAETLYHRFPGVPEGRLTEWRAHLVCGPTLSRVAREQLDLGRWLRLGRGEEGTGGREREGNLERAYEAMIGAVMLERGLDAARDFVLRTLGEELALLEREPEVLNPKGALQELAQGRVGRPEYVTLAQQGPEHDRRFSVEVRIDGERLGSGEGTTRQAAEKDAAREAFEALRARLAGDAIDDPADAGGAGDGEPTAKGEA